MRLSGDLILAYHRVSKRGLDPQLPRITPEHLAQQLEVLRAITDPVPLTELVEHKGTYHSKPRVAVTFDDGYADTLFAAAPMLVARGVPATVFVVAGALAQPTLFWAELLQRCLLAPAQLPPRLVLRQGPRVESFDLREGTREHLYRRLHAVLYDAVPERRQRLLADLCRWASVPAELSAEDGPMNTAQLQQLAALPGLEIGAHTVHHPRLVHLSVRAQHDEILQSRTLLTRALGRAPRAFAYPYGEAYDISRFTPWLVRAAGFSLACLCSGSVVTSTADRFRLPRLLVPDIEGDAFRRWLENRLARR